MITILAFATADDIVCLFSIIYLFKFWSLWQQDWFWLAVNMFIVHQLEKIILKVIPTISFPCLYCCGVDSVFFNIENDFYNYIFIVIVLDLNYSIAFFHMNTNRVKTRMLKKCSQSKHAFYYNSPFDMLYLMLQISFWYKWMALCQVKCGEPWMDGGVHDACQNERKCFRNAVVW